MRWIGIRRMMSSKSESDDSVWILVISPTIWSVHFLASYLTAAIWCAKFGQAGAPFGSVRVAIGLYTLIALAGIAWTAWIGYRRHDARPVSNAEPHDADSDVDRYGFLGFATLLLSGLSAIATIFVALAAVFVGSCD